MPHIIILVSFLSNTTEPADCLLRRKPNYIAMHYSFKAHIKNQELTKIFIQIIYRGPFYDRALNLEQVAPDFHVLVLNQIYIIYIYLNCLGNQKSLCSFLSNLFFQ